MALPCRVLSCHGYPRVGFTRLQRIIGMQYTDTYTIGDVSMGSHHYRASRTGSGRPESFLEGTRPWRPVSAISSVFQTSHVIPTIYSQNWVAVSPVVCRGIADCAGGGDEGRGGPQADKDQVERAKASALRMIGRRSHSRDELRRKLQEREYDDEVICCVLDRLEEVALQSDAEHAVIFARSKWRQSRWSPKKIGMELTRKGVAKEHISVALESVFGDEGSISVKRYMEEEGYGLDPNDIDSMSSLGHPEEALIQAAIRQYQSYASHISKEAKRRRLTGWLQRRGFSWDDVSRLISMAESHTFH